MNINASANGDSPKIENPPPIPPKSSLGFASSLTGSLERHGGGMIDLNSQESYSVPRVHVENGDERGGKQDESPC